jgi:pyrimidine deaminase RibD-like protein
MPALGNLVGEKLTDRQLMELAVEVARQSKDEGDGRPHPFVGAVVARPNGERLATGYRGEAGAGIHAEISALKKLPLDAAIGSTVFTTLEPCTERKSTTPCTLELIKHQVGQVVIGSLDPNPDIRGQGEWLLETNRIEIGKFEPDLVLAIRAMNREFFDYQLGLGFVITSPTESETIASGTCTLRGTYRVHPRPGDRIHVFTRVRITYWPQAPISYERDQGAWSCSVGFGTIRAPEDAEIIVARVSEDFAVSVSQYNVVHRVTKRNTLQGAWIGIEMPTVPPGFEVLASVQVKRV